MQALSKVEKGTFPDLWKKNRVLTTWSQDLFSGQGRSAQGVHYQVQGPFEGTG